MEKGYRLLKCPGECNKTLRISVAEKDYGKSILIVCPVCKQEIRTRIPTPYILSDPDVFTYQDYEFFTRLVKIGKALDSFLREESDL